MPLPAKATGKTELFIPKKRSAPCLKSSEALRG